MPVGGHYSLCVYKIVCRPAQIISPTNTPRPSNQTLSNILFARSVAGISSADHRSRLLRLGATWTVSSPAVSDQRSVDIRRGIRNRHVGIKKPTYAAAYSGGPVQAAISSMGNGHDDGMIFACRSLMHESMSRSGATYLHRSERSRRPVTTPPEPKGGGAVGSTSKSGMRLSHSSRKMRSSMRAMCEPGQK